jgi:hypothetical protein
MRIAKQTEVRSSPATFLFLAVSGTPRFSLTRLPLKMNHMRSDFPWFSTPVARFFTHCSLPTSRSVGKFTCFIPPDRSMSSEFESSVCFAVVHAIRWLALALLQGKCLYSRPSSQDDLRPCNGAALHPGDRHQQVL